MAARGVAHRGAAGRVARGLRPGDRAGSGVRPGLRAYAGTVPGPGSAGRGPAFRGHLPGPRLDRSSTDPKSAWRRCCLTRVRPPGPRRSGCSTRLRSTPSGAPRSTRLSFWTDTAETAIRLLRRLGEPGRGAGGSVPWVLDSVSWPKYLAYALAFRGHLREAFAVNERLLRQPSASPLSRWFDTFHDLSLLGIVPDSLARATYGRSLESAAGWADEVYEVPPRHLRGLPWWLSRGDTVALARFAALAARTARAPPTPRAALRARLLGETSVAFLDLARGDSTAAIRKLSAIPDTLCLADSAGNCFHLNLTLARLLAARGEDRHAGALLDRWRWSGDGSTPSFVLATLELGRIAERLGDTRKAAECYGFVMAAWRRPDRGAAALRGGSAGRAGAAPCGVSLSLGSNQDSPDPESWGRRQPFRSTCRETTTFRASVPASLPQACPVLARRNYGKTTAVLARHVD